MSTTKVLLAALLFASLGFSSTARAADEKQPNVIFILCDDLGWGDFGVFYQNDSPHAKRHRTPLIDQMAAEGMQLRTHYCPAPVCAPSRSSLLTGTHQGHAEVRDNQFDKMLEDNHTLATVMKSAGYRTALVGKYGLQGKGKSAADWPAYPTRRGFDDFFGYVRHVDGHVHYPADHWPIGKGENHQTPKEVWSNDVEVSAGLSKCYTTDLFTAKSKHWIQDHTAKNVDQPFFLYLAYDTPHAALQVPTMEYPAGRGIDGGIQWTGQPGHMINTANGEIDSYRHPEYIGHGWTDVEERFATMVRRIDDAIGDLLETLKDLNIADNTIVVISSDNGPHQESYLQSSDYHPTSFHSYGPMDGIKRDLWEGGIRMPTLAWWPGHIPAGKIDHTPSQFHDWMATFADVAGKPAPARCDGESLLPLLKGKSMQRRAPIYIEYINGSKTPDYPDFAESRRGKRRGQQQAIFMDGFKGIRVDIEKPNAPFAIYDVLKDAGERNNLAGTSPKFKKLQSKMQDRVLQIRRPNQSAPRPYDNVAVPSIGKLEAMTDKPRPGLAWSFYPGDFAYTPQVQSLAISSSGTSVAFDVPTPSSSGAIQWTGLVNVDANGVFEFTMKSDQPAFLRIHDASVIDSDFGHQAGQAKSASIKLAAGLHPIRVTVLAKDGQAPKVNFGWSGKQPIETALFQTK
ncbi:Arylsulfatase precursor [Rubripirellula tenax]|uniref:Arylsulfatase n=1 Tax=Rubripirellula tenax TaxID=2528015 RepID=A0A5C6FHD1_9BACT|nr:sulfatase-like hydrolase/transferase [Rubripirellula tenax]TWU60290.1 Arylsulfatase precursor [Rubripirellula tenax]